MTLTGRENTLSDHDFIQLEVVEDNLIYVVRNGVRDWVADVVDDTVRDMAGDVVDSMAQG